MCGIVGMFSFCGPPPHRQLWPTLVNHLHHRGPDQGAWWADGPFYLGHRRLSIIGLDSGAQPMATADGGLVVTFNGEIYNYPTLRRQLEQLGCRFETDSDTEVLLHGYRIWKEELPRHLTGMFAFAIADRRNHELFIARDRFGEKPLFYWRHSRYLAFASELRPLAAIPDIERKLDITGLGGYLSLNYVPGTRTLMHGIHRLPPANWTIISANGGERGATYWTPPDAPDEARQSAEDAVEEWREKFDRAVRLALLSDVPVGVLLSGGVDSALVAESAARQGKLSTAYFLDFAEDSYSEYDAASNVADRLGLRLQRAVLTPESLKNFLAIVEHADDPLADSSSLPVWTIAQLAAKGNKVVLGGDGGDELFGGYLTYKATQAHRKVIARLPTYARRFLARLGNRLPTSEKKVTRSYKLWRFLRAADLPVGVAHFSWNGTWLPNEVDALLRTEYGGKRMHTALSDLAIRHNLSEHCTLLALQRADITDYLPNDILTKTDRMSMAHGLEVRSPFLEHRFAEWALRRPDHFKISRGGESKSLLRKSARRVFGPSIADRPKYGFSVPLHAWVRGPLAEQVRDLLSPASIRELHVLDPMRVDEILRLHFSGRKSYGFEIWGLAVLVAWHRIRVQNPPTPPAHADLVERTFNVPDQNRQP